MTSLILLMAGLTGPGAQEPEAAPCADAPTCMEAGIKAAIAPGVDAALDAVPLLAEACNRGSNEACQHMRLLVTVWPKVGPIRRVEAEGDAEQLLRARYAGLCAEGAQGACMYEGVTLERGIGGDADPGEALVRFAAACSGEQPRACTLAGVLHQRGPVDWRDPMQAQELFNQACNANDAWGCHELSVMVGKGAGEGVAERATGYQRQACEGGYAAACLHEGPGVDPAAPEPQPEPQPEPPVPSPGD